MSLGINIQHIMSNPELATPILSFLRNDGVARTTEVSTVFKQSIDNYNQSLAADRRTNPNLSFDFDVVLEANELNLPDSLITSEEFFSNPLFKDTKEKKAVFNELIKITKEEGFLTSYRSFLSKLNGKDWFHVCQTDPVGSSFLSLLAFLNGKISVEELFIIHSVSMAYIELERNRNEGEMSVIDVKPRVLETEEIVEYLGESFFDFDFDDLESELEGNAYKLLSQIKMFDLDVAKNQFLKRVKERKSYIEKTFLECTLSPFASFHSKILLDDTTNNSMLSVFSIIRFKSKSDFGFKSASPDKEIAIFPPIGITLDLLRSVSKFGEMVQDPKLMFGHAMRYDVLFGLERPITGASHLFKPRLLNKRILSLFEQWHPNRGIRGAHDYLQGPLELGMYFHDLVYHLILEANIPHVEIFKEIGEKLLKTDLSKFNEDEIKCFRRFAGEILDREAYEYRRLLAKDAFWEFLVRKLQILKRGVSENSFNKYFEEIFLPLTETILHNYHSKEGHTTITKKSPREVLADLE